MGPFTGEVGEWTLGIARRTGCIERGNDTRIVRGGAAARHATDAVPVYSFAVCSGYLAWFGHRLEFARVDGETMAAAAAAAITAGAATTLLVYDPMMC